MVFQWSLSESILQGDQEACIRHGSKGVELNVSPSEHGEPSEGELGH